MTFYEKIAPYIYALFVWACTMLTPSTYYMAGVGVVIMVDTLTGSLLAKRRGLFTSRGFGRVWEKLKLYFPIIIMSFFIESIFFKKSPFELMHNLPIAYITSIGIVFNEVVSIDENLVALTGKSIIGFIKKFVVKLLPDKNKLFDDDDDDNTRNPKSEIRNP